MEAKANPKKAFLILGISREKRNWARSIKVLQNALPDYEIIALENKGMGEFNNEAAPLSINGNVDFLKASFDKLKGDENIFIGWSLGGMIVAKWSQRYPSDMSKMVLITSSFGALQPFWFRLKTLIIPKLFIGIFSSGKKREDFLYDATCNNLENKASLMEEWEQYQTEKPISGVNIVRQVVAAFFFLTRKLKKQHPTLVLGAPNDNLVNSKCSLNIKSFWNTDYAEHPTAGHDLFTDDPKWVSEQIKNWL